MPPVWKKTTSLWSLPRRHPRPPSQERRDRSRSATPSVTTLSLCSIVLSHALPAYHLTRSWQRSRRAGDVLAHRVRLALDFLQALLDHVADADHPAQPAILLDHRNVTDAPVGHQRHDRAHPIVR